MSSPLDPGERAVRFFNALTHTGDYSGQPFQLRPWQEEPIRRLFGTLRADGSRQYRRTFWALPRKQGKTELVAGGSLYLLLGQGRANQRIYTASGDTEQASLIFRAACEMIRNDPVLEQRLVIYDGYKRIEYPGANSSLKVLSSVPKSKHGLGPTAVMIDEYHVVSEELVNVLTTGFGARKDPLVWMITTAGWDRTSLCFDEWQYAERVRDGTVQDSTYLPVIYAAAPGDDWTSEEVWRRAMPALGDFCSIEFIRDEFKKAVERPRFQNTFRQLYLNQWTEQAERWLSVEKWAACPAEPIDAAALKDRPCFGGLDLGVTGDMAAFVRVFAMEDGSLAIVPRYYAPDQGKWRNEFRNRQLYLQWAEAGHLVLTPGDTTDQNQIEADIVAANKETPLRLLLADRAYASALLTRLRELHELPVLGIAQGGVTLNEPIVRFEELVIGGKIRHGGHPVLAWNAANAAVRRTSTGLLHLDKSQSTSRIDGLSATINALRGVIDQAAGAAGKSVYDDRGILIL